MKDVSAVVFHVFRIGKLMGNGIADIEIAACFSFEGKAHGRFSRILIIRCEVHADKGIQRFAGKGVAGKVFVAAPVKPNTEVFGGFTGFGRRRDREGFGFDRISLAAENKLGGIGGIQRFK